MRQYVAARKPSPYHHTGSSSQHRQSGHQVNYAYIFQEKQTRFVNALVGGEFEFVGLYKNKKYYFYITFNVIYISHLNTLFGRFRNLTSFHRSVCSFCHPKYYNI